MMRIVLFVFAAALACRAAPAMPADAPWTIYGCTTKGLALKFLSDGIGIEVLEAGGKPRMVSPVDEASQAGFKPGDYRGEDDFTLTIGADGRVALAGGDTAHGSYGGCVESPRSEGLWQLYRCDGSKSLELYFEFTSFVTVRTDDEEALVTRAPAAGQDVFDGIYRSFGRDATLTIDKQSVGFTGADVPGGPYENCANALKP